VAAFVTLDHGTFSRRRYHISALLAADVTMGDGPYSTTPALGAEPY
jgi:hypothetical protein